ncbi:NAD(P)H-dependent oxidoreductase [Actinoplanes sp. KI2]|uniref:CE1759 family FMN reductase n=1 Tax=Actinoplanes sp. KI2 TaxID=2983315 RepID=UPI0021D5999C|nr:CE1759 family FMN reductase [Actinoplanes sp. KI2]MCU7728700.1 NAD(P)H-dependent oxidoreductase [Actinoplanes sp. KI2]
MNQRSLVVISAGLSQPSSTRLLADQLSAAAVGAAASKGIDLTVKVIELRDLAHDIANNLLTGFPPAALKEATDAVAAADALIAVTPIFTASYSGLFKSFVDVLEKDTLAGKPVLIAATAGTARHSLALEHALRPLFAYLHAVVLPTAVFAATDDFGAAGGDSGADSAAGPLRSRITRAAGELADELERRDPVTVLDPFALTTNFEDLLKTM